LVLFFYVLEQDISKIWIIIKGNEQSDYMEAADELFGKENKHGIFSSSCSYRTILTFNRTDGLGYAAICYSWHINCYYTNRTCALATSEETT
jgi:hypothetical protein